jgi:hypothetical protein
LLSISCLAVRDNELSPVRCNNLNLPFLSLLDPFRASDLATGLDILSQVVLLRNFFQILVDVLATCVEAWEMGKWGPGELDDD